jgi:hypothetical protein
MRHRSTFLLALIGASLSVAADGPRTTALELQGNVAFVKASIGNSAPLDMVSDSGTIRTTLDESVAAKLGLDLSTKAQSSGARGMQEISVVKDQTLRLCGLEVTAFTGTTAQKQGRLQALQIGTIVVTEPAVGLNDFQFGDPNVFDGNLGSGFLKQFKLIFDLPHDRMILERPAGQ